MAMLTKRFMKFATKAIHAGTGPDAGAGAVVTPVYQAATYAQQRPGKHKGYTYSRTGNPTRAALEASLAALENGSDGFCFGSGMAAVDAVLRLLKPGDEVVATRDLYGGTFRLMTKVYEPYGLKFHFIDLNDEAVLLRTLTERTRLIWMEMPSNPLLYLTDIEQVVLAAKSREILTAVDSTFASPYLFNPLDWGIDIVVHSVTKYLGGHSDTVMGALVVKREDLADRLRFIQISGGAIPGPQDCFLALRGLKTLHVRMQRHCENAGKIAVWLSENPAVKRVYYPGLPSHPGHALAARLLRGFGGMISFEPAAGTREETIRIMERLQLFVLAESLGGVESLCAHPASMSHAGLPEEERAALGIHDTLIRLSVGIEDADDLVTDLKQALG